jgi:proteic killer suppression protein
MIRAFRCPETKAVFEGRGSRKFRNIESAAKRRLDVLHAAVSLTGLAAIRSNHLEALRGNRKGQHSIRVNLQWRICFAWKDGHAWNVEMVDYH